MAAKGIFVLLIFCTACMGGRIPCPKVKEAKLRRHYRPSPSALYARAEREREAEQLQRQQNREARPVDIKYTDNISVEEWDCPQPGAKRYKPKDVKHNIRKNLEKIRSDMKKKSEADSVSTR